MHKKARSFLCGFCTFQKLTKLGNACIITTNKCVCYKDTILVNKAKRNGKNVLYKRRMHPTGKRFRTCCVLAPVL